MANWTPTPTSGAISLNDVNLVAGKASGSQISFSNLYSGGNHWAYQNDADGVLESGETYGFVQRRQDATGVNGGGTITTNNNYSNYIFMNYQVSGQRFAFLASSSTNYSFTAGNDITTYYSSYSGTTDSSKSGTWHIFFGQKVVTGSYGSWINIDTNADKTNDASYRIANDYYRCYIRSSSTRLPTSGAYGMNNFYSMG